MGSADYTEIFFFLEDLWNNKGFERISVKQTSHFAEFSRDDLMLLQNTPKDQNQINQNFSINAADPYRFTYRINNANMRWYLRMNTTYLINQSWSHHYIGIDLSKLIQFYSLHTYICLNRVPDTLLSSTCWNRYYLCVIFAIIEIWSENAFCVSLYAS